MRMASLFYIVAKSLWRVKRARKISRLPQLLFLRATNVRRAPRKRALHETTPPLMTTLEVITVVLVIQLSPTAPLPASAMRPILQIVTVIVATAIFLMATDQPTHLATDKATFLATAATAQAAAALGPHTVKTGILPPTTWAIKVMEAHTAQAATAMEALTAQEATFTTTSTATTRIPTTKTPSSEW